MRFGRERIPFRYARRGPRQPVSGIDRMYNQMIDRLENKKILVRIFMLHRFFQQRVNR